MAKICHQIRCLFGNNSFDTANFGDNSMTNFIKKMAFRVVHRSPIKGHVLWADPLRIVCSRGATVCWKHVANTRPPSSRGGEEVRPRWGAVGQSASGGNYHRGGHREPLSGSCVGRPHVGPHVSNTR